MHSLPEPDLTCVPYRRKGLYYLLTIPVWIVLLLIVVYLWQFSFWFSLLMIALYLGISFFQAYCCHYSSCPYVGGFCPAVIGIMPASLFSKWLFKGKQIERSKKRYKRNVSFAMTCWVLVAVFPLYWLWQLNLWFAIGYVLLHLVYSTIFGLTICPVCAVRDSCPGGNFYKMFDKGKKT